MIARVPSTDAGLARDALWERTPQFRKLVTQLLNDPASPLPTSLNDGQRASVEAEVAARLLSGQPGLREERALLGDLEARPICGHAGRIARIRRALGLRQQDLAALIGVSRETVSHWENLDAEGNPQQRPTARNAAALAELVRKRLALPVDNRFFFDSRESANALLQRRVELLEHDYATLKERVAELERSVAPRPDLSEAESRSLLPGVLLARARESEGNAGVRDENQGHLPRRWPRLRR